MSRYNVPSEIIDEAIAMDRSHDLGTITREIHTLDKHITEKIFNVQLELKTEISKSNTEITKEIEKKQDKVRPVYLVVPTVMAIAAIGVGAFQLKEVYGDRHTGSEEEENQKQVYAEIGRTKEEIYQELTRNKEYDVETRARTISQGDRIQALETRHIVDDRVKKFMTDSAENEEE